MTLVQQLRAPIGGAIAAVALLTVLFSTLLIVPEGEQAVVFRMGQPVRVLNRYHAGEQPGASGAGLAARLPIADRVAWVDKRVRSVDSANQGFVTADRLPLVVDATMRFRITDPVTMLRKTGGQDALSRGLEASFGGLVRADLARRPSTELLAADQTAMTDALRSAMAAIARRNGAEVIDVAIRNVALPAGASLDEAIARMSAARRDQLAAVTAAGRDGARQVREAGGAAAARIRADSFGQDAEFYAFYRAMQSYRKVLGTGPGSTSIVLSPGNQYLQQFEGRR